MASLVKDRKTGTYFIVTSQGKKKIWRSTKTKDKKEAYQFFLKATTPPPKAATHLLFSLKRDYLLHVKANFAKKTHAIYTLTLDHFCQFAGDVAIDQITPQAIDQYKVHRVGSVSAATVNLELRGLKAFFNTLRRWEIIPKSPAESIRPIREAEETPAFLTGEELQKLLDSIVDAWLRKIVLFTAMTGLRLGEVLNLRWEDVDMERRMVLVHSTVGYQVKGGKIRSVPLNQTAFELLNSFKEREGIVFRGKRGGHAYGNHVSGRFRKAVRAAGLDEKLHFHSLRHSFASQLVQKGVSLYMVQRLLGHSSPRVTEIYSHLQSNEMHGIVDTISLNQGAN